ncbi:hypothetical protein Bca101_036422 [Brassica carinata]
MKICQFVADLVRRSVSVGEVVVGFCSLPWCLEGSSFSIIHKLDFVGFARLARDCVEDLGGVRFILPAACVAERMVLGAWRCLVLRRRLSGQAAPSLSYPVHGCPSPGRELPGFLGFQDLVLHLCGHSFCLFCPLFMRGNSLLFYEKYRGWCLIGFVVMELSSTARLRMYHPSVEVPHLIALGRYSLVLLSAGPVVSSSSNFP